MILYSAGISAGFGLLIAIIAAVRGGGNIFRLWLMGFAGVLGLMGGVPLGGLLTLIFQKWDDGFCEKAGNILWYGTTIGGVALSQLLKFDLSMGVFVAAFVISALACSILKDWGEHGEGKEAAKTSIIIVLSLVAVAYAFSIRAHNEAKATNTEKEKAAYDSAYDEGYQQGRKDQEESDWEKLTIEGMTIEDMDNKIYDFYGMSPREAAGLVESYLTDENHGGWTWEEYQTALSVCVDTAAMFPER